MPMRKNSTLIYVVNRIESENKATSLSRIETIINNLFYENPEIGHSPSEKTIENILNFSRSYDVKKTESAGFVEMNLN